MALTGGIFSTWRFETCSKTQNKVHSFLGHRSGRYREITVLVVSRNNHQTLGREGRYLGGIFCLFVYFCFALFLFFVLFLNSNGEDPCLLECKGDLWYHHSWRNPPIANATTVSRASSALGGKLWCAHSVKMKAWQQRATESRSSCLGAGPHVGRFSPNGLFHVSLCSEGTLLQTCPSSPAAAQVEHTV